MKKLIVLYLTIAGFWSCYSGESPAISASDAGGSAGTGLGGSTARFMILGDFLYVLGGTELYTLSIENPDNPELKNVVELNTFAETIFSMDNYLLLGTQTGVLFYSVSNPQAPSYLSTYEHIVSCDPVVAKGDYAYSTLRSGNACFQGVDELDVINIENILSPYLTGQIEMINPKGLAISGDYLFVCDANQLIRFDLSNPASPSGKTKVADLLGCYDIIPVENRLIITSSTGVTQLEVLSNGTLKTLSHIAVD